MVVLVDEVLERAVARRASDVHFEPADDGLVVRFRIDGLLHRLETIPDRIAENVIARLKVLSGLLTYRIDVPQEGSFRFASVVSGALDVRVAVFPTVRGERVAVRLLHRVGHVSGLEELGLAAGAVRQLRLAAERPQGLILVTGPSGSGKSTTLYALARHILAAQPGRCAISLEDPVEQRITGLTQIQISPHGELDYARAMRSLLRQDVEVLLVGEIRDAQTAHVVIEAALTGHLIMSTMHSGDPAEAIARLLEMAIASYQVVGALTVCCSQRLLRRLCLSCGRESARDNCDECGGTGYIGRTACTQIAAMSDSLRECILAHAPAGELRRVVNAAGPDLMADAQRLIDAGLTTSDEVRRVL